MSYFIGLELFINTGKAFFYSYISKVPKILWYKVLITLALIIIYRIGTYIPIPGIDIKSLHQIFILEIGNYDLFHHINFLMGGSLGRISIFSLNLIPYLSANLLFNSLILSNRFFKEKIKNDQTLFLIQSITVIIAIIQSYGILIYLKKINNYFYEKTGLEILTSEGNNFYFTITTIFTLVISTLILQWIAQKITNYGIANGITTILLSGIIAEISKSIWEISIPSKIVIVLTFLIIAYLVLLVEQSSISIPILPLQFFSLWYEKQNPILFHITIPINIFGITPLIIYQILYGIVINFNKKLLIFSTDLGSLYYFLQILILMISCLIVRIFLINNLSRKEVLFSIKKQMLAFHGFHLGKEISNYLNLLFNSLIGINFLYFLLVSLIPDIIYYLVSNFYNLDNYHLNGITIFLIVKIAISIIKEIKSNFLYNISKQIGRKEAIDAFFLKKNKKTN